MELEEQVRAYREMGKQLEELEQKRKVLGATILQQMDGKSMEVAEYRVRRYSRLSIKLSLREARLIDAVKMKEVIDTDRIKQLYQDGAELAGVSEMHYVQVTLRKQELCDTKG